MATTSSDFLVQRLYDWGVSMVYGYPGDGINGVMGALNRAKEKVRFIQARHEEEAAFMACAHAKFTGEIGGCVATSGPGAIHLLNGLYDAKLDHQPVLAIVGQQATTALGADYQQEVDLVSLAKDVAGQYVHMTSSPAMIGSGFPYAEFLPREGDARGVQIDLNPRMLSLRYPMEVNLQGDSSLTLRALLPLLEKKRDRHWRETIEKEVRDWWLVMEARAMMPANPINPQRLFWELSPRLPENCIITCDSGSAANWYARDLKMHPGIMASLSGGLASMCPGVPYAIAAKLNYPGRAVITLVGDGAMQMLGINGLITISKYWKNWSKPTLVVLVLNNRDHNMVTWEQRVMNGDPKFDAS